jgi:DNA repair exonuclease SbcCD ATPase subunit
MKIVRLEAENVKRLRAVRIEPTGDLVVIGGRNAQGKTSVLDAIEMALGGTKAIPDVPIRRGEDSARVVLQLDGKDGLTVTRKFTAKGSYLDVRKADGSKPASPQALLDSLCNRVAFDPLSWIRAKPAEQAETLRRLVGIDFTAVDAERKRLYDLRTDANRRAKQEAAAADGMGIIQAPDEPISVAGLMAELRRRQDINRDVSARMQRFSEQQKRLSDLQRQADETEAEIQRLKTKLGELRERCQKGEAWIATEQAELDKIETGSMAADVGEVERQIADSERINAAVRNKQKQRQHRDQAQAAEAKAAELTKAIDKIDEQKAAELAAAAWPIPGLGFDAAGGVTFSGLPLDQASGMEQNRIAVAIGLALNPKLPVILIRDGSLLDEDAMRAVAQQATAAGAQVWLERVGKGAECSVVIEDGEVE